MPNQIIAPQSVQYSTHQQRKSSDAPLQFPPPPPIVPKPRTDAAFFADKFFEECRVNPLDYRNCVPSNLVGMRMCAKSRCWKHVIDISSSILDGKSGLEYIVTSNKLNDGSSKKLVLSPVLSLRLEGLFRLQMFDEVIEEIHNTITSATSLLSPESLSTAGATASTRTSTFGGNVNMGLLSNPKYASVLSMTDFNTQMILNMLLIEVRLLTGRSEDALQELYAIREQVYVDVDSVANASVEMSPPEVQLCLEKFYWFWTVSCTILSTICRQRQWRLAVTEFTKMITEIQKLSNIISFNKDMSTNRNDLSALTTLHNNIILAEITIRCRLCRLLCQMGAIHPATNCLLAVIETVQENSSIVELDTIINSPKENIQLFVKSAMENEGCEVFRTNPLYKAGLASICVSAGLIFYCLNEVNCSHVALVCFNSVCVCYVTCLWLIYSVLLVV